MNQKQGQNEILIKLAYIAGLDSVVLNELGSNNLSPISVGVEASNQGAVYIPYAPDAVSKVLDMRSVTKAYLVQRDEKYNPYFVSNHKSILGGLVGMVFNPKEFLTFKISCAGSGSVEVRSIADYITNTYKLREEQESDLKIHLHKIDDIWEIGVQITSRPLSLRPYKIANIPGGIDPTIAYAMNSLCNLSEAHSYLNVFSGSATLLIEAAQTYPNLTSLVGFDNDKKHISLSIQNIRHAGLIRKVEVKEADIFDLPNFGTFDAITSDLPFGMAISKNEDLQKLYAAFLSYAKTALAPNGVLVVYTSETQCFESVIKATDFKILRTLELQFTTSVNSFLRPYIYVCMSAGDNWG